MRVQACPFVICFFIFLARKTTKTIKFMKLEEVLFGLTFVYGVLQLLSYTIVFERHLDTITESLTSITPNWLKLVGYWFLYFSLFYQSIFWAKYFNIL